MHLPVLNIPSVDLARRPKPAFKPKTLRKWLDELPMANTQEAARSLMRQLATINRGNYSVDERMQLLGVLLLDALNLSHALGDQLKKAPPPLSERLESAADLRQMLLAELANGYKLVISELALLEQENAAENPWLIAAIYFAIRLLALRLVCAYQLYQPEPEEVWRELNELYRYAEACELTEETVEDQFDPPVIPLPKTVGRCYRQVVLLALAEPYNLMHNEVWEVFLLAGTWAHALQLLPIQAQDCNNEYVIDMSADDGPSYCHAQREYQPVDGRILDISSVRKQIRHTVQYALRYAQQHGETHNLQVRQQRDMLLRVAAIWDHPNTRKSTRRHLGAQAQIATGLNACHFFASLRSAFTPEMDELRIRTLHNTDSRGAVASQTFGSAYREALKKDRKFAHNGYAIKSLSQQNISSHGMSLNIKPGQQANAPARVGELIAYRFGVRPSERWHIGTVRWLRHSRDTGTDLGVMHLAQTSVPIAVRAEASDENGNNYFRGLLVPKQVSLQQVRSIIVPASLYDVNSRIVMNMGRRLYRLRLTRMLQSTPMFAQFEFENVDQGT